MKHIILMESGNKNILNLIAKELESVANQIAEQEKTEIEITHLEDT